MDQTEITRTIKQARPALKVVSPLVAKIIVGFAVLNVILGLSLLFKLGYTKSSLVIAPTEIAFQIWGGVFILLGLTKAIAYKMNNWRLIKNILIVAVLVKLTWAIALVVQYVSDGFVNPFLLVIWLFITHVQAMTYIHFMPTPFIEKGVRNADK